MARNASGLGKGVGFAHDQAALELFGGIGRSPINGSSFRIACESAGQLQLGICQGVAAVVCLEDGDVSAAVVHAHVDEFAVILFLDGEG